MIEELTFLPVQFHRQMGATVQIGMNPALKTHDKRRLADAVTIYREAHTAPALDQFIAGADQSLIQACCRSQAAISAILAAQ